jgi:Flp pilus assembly protein TadG
LRLTVSDALPIRLCRRFIAGRRGAAAVEFALTSMALFLFLFAIVNLGLLGLTLGALQHGTEQAAREAAVTAAKNPADCRSSVNSTAIQNYFYLYAAPVISRGATPSYSIYTDGSAALNTANDPWVDNGSGTPPGTYIALTETYNWAPIGFAKLHGFTLKISTVAFAMGSPTC